MNSREITLKLFNQYDREDVHDIFDPYSKFTKGAGTWGRQGIVKVPHRSKDFVFFVTYGRSQKGHTFEEKVTDEGLLTWQSQPSNKLNSNIIQTLIKHDYTTDNIFLFLRTREISSITKQSEPFTYMGKLGYITHDIEREKPVYFKWQLLEWPEISLEVLRKMKLETIPTIQKLEGESGLLTETNPPLEEDFTKGESTVQFQALKRGFTTNYAEKVRIGDLGELLALEHFKKKLNEAGRSDLARDTRHISKTLGDGMGYDIETYDLDGNILFVEVKTTTAGKNTPFYIYINELNYSKYNPESYMLLRIFNYDEKNNRADSYRLRGDVSKHFKLKVNSYKAKLHKGNKLV